MKLIYGYFQQRNSILLLLFITTITFYSCNKDKPFSEAGGGEQITVPNEEMPESIYKTPDDIEDWIEPDPQYNVLGYGYDMGWALPNPSGVRHKIFDVDRYLQDESDRILIYKSSQQSLLPVNTANAQELMQTLGNQYKGLDHYTLFKRGWNYIFGIDNFFDLEYIYAANTYTVRTMILRLSIPYQPEKLKNYLNQNFKEDINMLTPADLVSKYGTHFLDNIALGIKLDFIYQAKTIYDDRAQAALLGLNNSYSRIFYNLPIEYDPSAVPGNYAERTYYRSWGGDPDKSMYGLVSNKYGFRKENIAAWQATINDHNVVLVDFPSTNDLTPIYELITDPIKKDAVRQYIEEEYLK